jgi:hypothetical protein
MSATSSGAFGFLLCVYLVAFASVQCTRQFQNILLHCTVYLFKFVNNLLESVVIVLCDVFRVKIPAVKRALTVMWCELGSFDPG